jgi:tetratricopeptide (TPR) repeat protein
MTIERDQRKPSDIVDQGCPGVGKSVIGGQAAGNYHKAIGAFESALFRGQDYWSDLWDVYETRGDVNGIVQEIESPYFLESTMSRWEALINSCKQKPNSTERTIKVYGLFIRVNPTTWHSWAGLGNELFAKNDLAGAIAADERALRNRPPYQGLPPLPRAPYPWPPLPMPDSLPTFLAPLPAPTRSPEPPTSPSVVFVTPPPLLTEEQNAVLLPLASRLGEFYEITGNHVKAMKIYRQYVSEGPQLWWGWSRLNECYIMKGDYDQAIETLRLAMTSMVLARPR